MTPPLDTRGPALAASTIPPLSVRPCGTRFSNTQEGPNRCRSAPITDPLFRGFALGKGMPSANAEARPFLQDLLDAPVIWVESPSLIGYLRHMSCDLLATLDHLLKTLQRSDQPYSGKKYSFATMIWVESPSLVGYLRHMSCDFLATLEHLLKTLQRSDQPYSGKKHCKNAVPT